MFVPVSTKYNVYIGAFFERFCQSCNAMWHYVLRYLVYLASLNKISVSYGRVHFSDWILQRYLQDEMEFWRWYANTKRERIILFRFPFLDEEFSQQGLLSFLLVTLRFFSK